ncbi:hypothetical protein FisN_3Lh113 [Fistulifera solaris]|uniref:Uncharacterized protein n=1 Tax=Fistulifera solaris TaxID=1519565 RepID=A0A1Z5KTH1_FISSO|nr:hypothetical protein FisN_3Lh113 [Fistulifera solaris]|eukprot:GAX29620.1 hypothetical protein FisN_3Lh113 [Fistulifera solaris]
MKELSVEKWALYGAALVTIVLLSVVLQRIPRWRKPPLWVHPVYAAITAAICRLLIPDWIQDELFSPGGVLLVGTILPVYNSIVALCTVSFRDDEVWLQYWITWGSLSFLTEFMDNITVYLPQAGEHWYEFELFTVLWLVLPFTNGAAVVYDSITKPYLTPIAQKLAIKMQGWIQLLLSLVNTSYLWTVWYLFTWLPEEQRRFIVIAVGTAYPLAASIVALGMQADNIAGKTRKLATVTTESLMVTKWLTYWATYMLLFVAMDYLENFVGHIRGFYSLCVFATLYLALPMFDGAEVIFRRVLVPLTGQYETLILRDIWLMKQDILAKLPENKQKNMMTRASAVFAEIDEMLNDKES